MERQGRPARPGPHPPEPGNVARLLHRFYQRCADSDLPELICLATTVQTWWPPILAFLHTGITNAGSEGTNRVIKTAARDAYGFRNPNNQRLRTRCATTRKAADTSTPATSKSRIDPEIGMAGWQTAVKDSLRDRGATIHIALDGMDGATHVERFVNAYSAGRDPKFGATDWEMAQFGRAVRRELRSWDSIKFYHGGA